MRHFYVCISLLIGCGRTGQRELSVPVKVTGKEARSVLLDRNGTLTNVDPYVVTLTNVKLAVGPLYFCATAAASSSLCDTAVAEVREVFVIDGLSAVEKSVGTAKGITGAIRSAQLDYAVSWLPTQQAPTAILAGTRSLELSLSIARGAEVRHLSASFDLVSSIAGERAIVGKKLVDELREDSKSLRVDLDPHAWLLGAPIERWFERGEFAAEDVDLLRQAAAINAPPTFEFVE